MNRFIIGKLGVLAVFATVAVGCTVSTISQDQRGSSEETDSAEVISAGEAEFIGGTERILMKPSAPLSKKAAESSGCPGCGPVPDPWKTGPVPDPWTQPNSSSSSSSSSSSGGSSSGSSGAGTGSESNRKP